MRLTHLEIKGYRPLYSVSVKMRPLMVLIGPNGAGKTSFLEVLHLLRNIAKGNLLSAVVDKGGPNSLLTKAKQKRAKQIAISFTADIPGHKGLQYKIAFAPQNLGSAVVTVRVDAESLTERKSSLVHMRKSPDSTEFLDVKGTKLVSTHSSDENESAFPQTPPHAKVVTEVRAALQAIAYYPPPDIAADSPLRQSQKLAPGMFPSANGERLFSALYNMRTRAPEYFERITDYLRVAFPDFDRIDFPVVASGTVALLWFDNSLESGVDQTELSEGTLRFLWLLATLLSPEKPPLLLLDEPEVSLHPQLLMLLADALRDASMDSQIIVATHSDRLLRWLSPEDITVFDKEDGIAEIHQLSAKALQSWLEDYTLDQLWQMGTIGGRP